MNWIKVGSDLKLVRTNPNSLTKIQFENLYNPNPTDLYLISESSLLFEPNQRKFYIFFSVKNFYTSLGCFFKKKKIGSNFRIGYPFKNEFGCGLK